MGERRERARDGRERRRRGAGVGKSKGERMLG